MKVVCLLTGGPTLKISVQGKIYTFEDHPYCGPTVLNQRGDPASVQPMSFLKAASLWCAQGKRVEDGLCRWDQIVGYEPAVRGD